jgi:hypothetical protein
MVGRRQLRSPERRLARSSVLAGDGRRMPVMRQPLRVIHIHGRTKDRRRFMPAHKMRLTVLDFAIRSDDVRFAPESGHGLARL